MTKPTDYDAAGVSQETAGVIAELENLAAFLDEMGFMKDVARVESAIDRLIVLDHARPTVKESLTVHPTVHPRERALHQDAKRGNFRQEDDGA